MRLMAVTSLISLLLGSQPAWGWAIKAPPAVVERLRADEATLPACVLAEVSKRLRVVYAAPKLTKWPNDATSWPQGFMVLNTDMEPLDTAYIHELGHYYDWVVGVSGRPEFLAAHAEDFAAMDKAEESRERFLLDPAEAFAELFAAHFRGDAYWKTDYYDAWRFPATKQAVLNSLCSDTPARTTLDSPVR